MLLAVVDRFAIEGIFVNGVAGPSDAVGDTLRSWQNGNLQRYAAVIAIAAAAILWAVLGTGGH